jgi:hypothetical protein
VTIYVGVANPWLVGVALLGLAGAHLAAYRVVAVRAAGRRRAALITLWLLATAAVLVAPLALADHVWHPSGAFWRSAFVALGALAGLVFSVSWLGWYLLLCNEWGGHENEVGAAARIDRYVQLIRFRVTDAALTGYVVRAVWTPTADGVGVDVTPELIDVFTVTAPPGARVPPPETSGPPPTVPPE